VHKPRAHRHDSVAVSNRTRRQRGAAYSPMRELLRCPSNAVGFISCPGRIERRGPAERDRLRSNIRFGPIDPSSHDLARSWRKTLPRPCRSFGEHRLGSYSPRSHFGVLILDRGESKRLCPRLIRHPDAHHIYVVVLRCSIPRPLLLIMNQRGHRTFLFAAASSGWRTDSPSLRGRAISSPFRAEIVSALVVSCLRPEPWGRGDPRCGTAGSSFDTRCTFRAADAERADTGPATPSLQVPYSLCTTKGPCFEMKPGWPV